MSRSYFWQFASQNFSKHSARELPDKVNKFYAIESKSFCLDKTCCMCEYVSPEVENDLFARFEIGSVDHDVGSDAESIDRF